MSWWCRAAHFPALNGNGSSYGVNAGLCGYMPLHFPINTWHGLYSLRKVRTPWRIIVLGDTGEDGPNRVPNYRPWSVGQFGYRFHSGKCNFVFLDGHVGRHALTDMKGENMDPAL